MKITYTPCLKKKYSADNFGTIQIRRTENRKSSYFTLSISMKTKYWLKSGAVSSTFSEHEEINTKIAEKINELKLIDSSDKSIIPILPALVDETFIEFFNSQLSYLQTRKEIGSYKAYKTSYYHLSSFLKEKKLLNIKFGDLSASVMRDFETYLLGQDLSINSVLKYIKTVKAVYNKGVELDKFVPTKNPFITLNKKSTPVDKKTLGRHDIELIFKAKIERDNSLYHYKNYFLFQIFAQGLRVSDLMTLRWGNLATGEIIINQFKTKNKHRVSLNFIILLRLADYLEKGSKIVNQKYGFTYAGVKYSYTYNEIEAHYDRISTEHRTEYLSLIQSKNESHIARVTELEKLFNGWLDLMNKMREKVKAQLILEVVAIAKVNPKKFVFPILDDKIFKDVEFTAQKHILSTYQYNQLASKTTYYNRQLKKLQELCNINVNITSHLARHSYTSLMIETTNKDIYTISKSLGHTNISTTEHYVNEFLTDRIDSEIEKFNDNFITVR